MKGDGTEIMGDNNDADNACEAAPDIVDASVNDTSEESNSLETQSDSESSESESGNEEETTQLTHDKILTKKLLAATKKGNIHDIIELLREEGANVNAVDSSGHTLLSLAVANNKQEVIKLLLEKGANANMANEYKQTPLYRAVSQDNTEVTKLLLENGADADIAEQYGDTPLSLAVTNGNLEVTKLLLENGASANIVDGSRLNSFTLTPLHTAVSQDNTEVTKLLLEYGADTNAVVLLQRVTPLFIAVSRNNSEVTKLLLEYGADANIADSNGVTPLFIAVGRNNLEVTKLLLEYGADANIADSDGVTPLSLLSSAVADGNLGLHESIMLQKLLFSAILADDLATGADKLSAALATINSNQPISIDPDVFASRLEKSFRFDNHLIDAKQISNNSVIDDNSKDALVIKIQEFYSNKAKQHTERAQGSNVITQADDPRAAAETPENRSAQAEGPNARRIKAEKTAESRENNQTGPSSRGK